MPGTLPGKCRDDKPYYSYSSNGSPSGSVKEREAFLRVWIDTDGFTLHVMAFKVRHCRIDIINAKSQMTQAASFRSAGASGGNGNEKKLNHILPIKRQIPFPRVARFAIDFALQRETKNIAVQSFADRIIRRNNRKYGEPVLNPA